MRFRSSNATSTDDQHETYGGTLAALEEMFGPALEPGVELEQKHVDIAAALQLVVQECLLHTISHFVGQTGHRDLCMAGGVALNCTANGMIQRSGLVKRMFIQPAAGDDGTALGAALWVQHREAERATPTKDDDASVGAVLQRRRDRARD